MSDLITISSSVLPYSARVLGFRGTETISRPYHFEIFIQLRYEIGEEFDLADAIGAKARLIIDPAKLGTPPFLFAGVFANVEVLHAYDGQVLVRAHLVPRLWQLGLSRHSRVFTKMKVPDIISAVLSENGITDYELRLGSYEVEEHVCQYRESDLDFISRWMEREGIFYFFEHGDGGEKLILSDQLAYDPDELGAPVRYFPQAGEDHSAGQHFRAFTCRQTTLPASVRLKDYDYAKPNLNVIGVSEVAENGSGEVSVYGNRFFTPSAGARLARVRAEELLAKQTVYHARGNRLYLRPGYTFELEEHAFPSFNTKYLTVEARHSGNQAVDNPQLRELMGLDHSLRYTVEADAILAKTQYRAESLTAWPRIYGHENGVVDGPAESEYAQIDEQGRYNAKFKFDESSLKNGKATTFVRMMQPHGGDIEGFHFPLRKGTEVVFSFLGGDPDRPVISGVVHNALHPSAVTVANYTKNVIQTGGRNRIEIEDLGGGQWMHLSTPASTTHLFMGTIGEGDHNFILETQGTGHIHTHGLLDVNVEGTLTEVVVGDVSETYESDTTQTVTGHKTTTVNSGQTETINAGSVQTINAGATQTINAFSTQTINGPTTQTITGPTVQSITGPSSQFIVGATLQNITGTYTQNFVGPMTTTITGAVQYTVNGGDVTWTIADDVNITCNDWTVEQKGEVSWSNLGNITHTKAENSLEVTLGTTTELMVGLQTEVMVGGTIEASLAAALELTAAAKAAITIGVNLEIDAALHFEASPFHVDILAGHEYAVADAIHTVGAKMHMGGLANYLVGLLVAE
jgi:type VI secretion system secreted protein VgrG